MELPFEEAISIVVKDKILADETIGEDVWGALSNVTWVDKNGEECNDGHGYSFRGAGSLIAKIFGKGDYMDWYCSGNTGAIPEFLQEEMSRYGWFPLEVPENYKFNYKDMIKDSIEYDKLKEGT